MLKSMGGKGIKYMCCASNGNGDYMGGVSQSHAEHLFLLGAI